MAIEDKDSDLNLAGLTKAMETLAEGQKTLTSFMTQQAQGQQQLSQTISALSGALEKGLNVNPPPKSDETPDFSSMDSTQTVTFLLSEIKKMNQETSDAFDVKIEGMKGDMNRSKRTLELNDVRNGKGNEDFDDFLPEMTKLAEGNPTMTADQLLKLSRIENPEKAQKLRDEINTKSAEKDPKNEETPFSGLTPTSTVPGGVDLDDDDKDGTLTIREGLEKAWDEVVPEGMKQTIVREGPMF